MVDDSKIADIFKACATCKNYGEMRTSIGGWYICKKHSDFPIRNFECHMSIVCDDYECDIKPIRNYNFFELDNKANFRRKGGE